MKSLLILSPASPSSVRSWTKFRASLAHPFFLAIVLVFSQAFFALPYNSPLFAAEENAPSPIPGHPIALMCRSEDRLRSDADVTAGFSPAQKLDAMVFLTSVNRRKVRDYVMRWVNEAQACQEKFGTLASVSIAQAIVESGFGSSKVCSKTLNHFGIKCFGKNCNPGHCIQAKDDSPLDRFKCFHCAEDSWRWHGKMLSQGRYASLKDNGLDAEKWAHDLKALGYATNKFYDTRLIAVIRMFHLDGFDRI